jgi:hypothetical protein
MRIREIALAFVAATLFTACGATQLYDGKRLPAEEVVLIDAEYPAKITRVNGWAVTGSSFEILPGKHSLHFEAKKKIKPSMVPFNLTTSCSVSVDLSAGQHYIVRGRYERERLAEPKAPYGSVTRFELTLDLDVADDGASPPALECPGRKACLILWIYPRRNMTATCEQYDNPRFRFRHDDDDEDKPLVKLNTDHCDGLNVPDKLDCLLEGGSKVLLFSVDDDQLLTFAPRDWESATDEKRTAAHDACADIDEVPELVSCLSDHGYELQE